jgi:membrane protein required for colicin V production
MPTALAALTVPDTIVLAICLILALRGAWKGFVWQAVRTVGLIGALWGATQFYGPVGDWMDRSLSFVPQAAAPALAWVLILLGTFLVFAFLAHMARGAIRTAQLSSVDRALGLGLGFLMGLVVCVVIFVVWGHVMKDDELHDTLDGSISARYLAKTVEGLDPLFPEAVRDRFRKSLDALDALDDPQS